MLGLVVGAEISAYSDTESTKVDSRTVCLAVVIVKECFSGAAF
jgi:hypothetical protein